MKTNVHLWDSAIKTKKRNLLLSFRERPVETSEAVRRGGGRVDPAAPSCLPLPRGADGGVGSGVAADGGIGH